MRFAHTSVLLNLFIGGCGDSPREDHIGFTAALLFIENRRMIIGLYDQWFHFD
jgi:hypothetical protein